MRRATPRMAYKTPDAPANSMPRSMALRKRSPLKRARPKSSHELALVILVSEQTVGRCGNRLAFYLRVLLHLDRMTSKVVTDQQIIAPQITGPEHKAQVDTDAAALPPKPATRPSPILTQKDVALLCQ